ncbi:MAG TPA: hypothetical protein C5S51_08255 [Methanosarcinaceae archaeon]|nr:hypothetical protein [Methanosarcinaceae archaeon]
MVSKSNISFIACVITVVFVLLLMGLVSAYNTPNTSLPLMTSIEYELLGLLKLCLTLIVVCGACFLTFLTLIVHLRLIRN